AVPATKTVTAQMLAVAAIAAAYDPTLVPAADLTALPGAVSSLLTDSAVVASALPRAVSEAVSRAVSGAAVAAAARWADARRLIVTGRGLAYAAALQIALKVNEPAPLHP